MLIRVKVQERIFEVEVGALNREPILATIEGETFEVWLDHQVAASPPAPNGKAPAAPLQPISRPAPDVKQNTVYAPIPGTVITIAVEPGDQVSVGQKLCTLEAMKMQNVIYAVQAGEIAKICVAPGQQVKHHAPLMEFA